MILGNKTICILIKHDNCIFLNCLFSCVGFLCSFFLCVCVCVILFLWHINHNGLFNARAFLIQEQQYLTHCWMDNEVHTFANSTNPKVNVIARLEFDLAYFEGGVQNFSHYTMETLTSSCVIVWERDRQTETESEWERVSI